MQNFNYWNPVRIVFGKGSIAELAHLVPASAKVMLVYGGGSIRKNGVYHQVLAALSGRTVLEFPGIEPNPKYETCMNAVEICRTQGVDFLLSVGGGSVLDGTKFIAAAVDYKGKDPWEILNGAKVERAIPLGCVLTLPATGSEMNAGAVISRNSSQEKLYFGTDFVYPKFSILDPETTFSLPVRQTVNGIVDIFVHVLEQYATYPSDSPLQDRQAESILSTLLDVGPRVLANPKDYEARASIMWCATQALNGNIGQGVPQDWSTHGIGHEITAFYGLDHAQTLAIIWPGLALNRLQGKMQKLTQLGRRVFAIQGDDEYVAVKAISTVENFFVSLGCPVRLSAYNLDARDVAQKVGARFLSREMGGMGERGDVSPSVIKGIIESRQ